MKMITLLMMMFSDAGSATTPDVELLDFTASYCQPCQQMVPVLQRMERDKFPIRRIDITEEHGLAQQYKVDRIPTLVLLVEGKEIKRFVGLTDEAELRSEMNRAARRLSETREDNSAQADPKPKKTEPPADEIQTAENRNSAGARSSIKDLFKGILGGGSSRGAFEFPTVRGQSPDGPAAALHGLQAAAAATVRVRVAGISTKDGKKVQDVGTGTIIYSATGQAIILTCAHIFLDIGTSDAVIEVEMFDGGQVNPFPATLIGGDHNSDLAMLRIQTSKIFPSVPVSPQAPKVSKGQALVSFGCNGGDNPTQLDMKLVDINRYDGPANLVCTTDPKSGRSGGGLFNTSGDLAGVCSCADRKRQEGLYMAHSAVLELVKKLKLQTILMTPPTSGGEDAASSFNDLLEGRMTGPANDATRAPVPISSGAIAKIEEPAFDQSSVPGAGDSSANSGAVEEKVERGSSGSVPNDSNTTRSVAATARTGPEVMIVIDDKTPGSQKKVIVIPQASAWMMELLTGELSDGTPSAMTAALRPAIAPAVARTAAQVSNRMSENTSLK
jgi:thiol-disulfide isomerase/thioredoxin